MEPGTTDPSHRRSRILAIAAGAITVVAIVLALASGYLGLTWLWLRPAAELLLLAELVGLIVLERHQLFEPVHEKVSGMEANITDIRERLGLVTQQLGSAGQTTVYPTPHELLRALTRLIREAFTRDQDTPQILRMARLAGEPTALVSDPEYAGEFQGFNAAIIEGLLSSRSPADSKSRWWSVRILGVTWNSEQFDFILEQLVKGLFEQKPLNFEIKFLLQPGSGHALLSPVITDREAMLTFDDPVGMFRWGILFQGRQYVALLARWFDEMWTSVPDNYLVYSHNGLNQNAVDLIRKELNAGVPRRTA